MTQYPSLAADDFTQSSFVWRPQRFDKAAALSRGADMLNVAAQNVRTELEGKPWSQVERWLEQLDRQVPNLRQQVRDQLPRGAEADLWNLNAKVISSAYDLQLQAVWVGPTSRGSGYQLTRTCRVTQGRRPGSPSQFNFNDSAPPATAPARTKLIGTVRCAAIDPLKQIEQTKS